jgi:SAM-dependent methyltransferase
MSRKDSEYQEESRQYYRFLRALHTALFGNRARQDSEFLDERYSCDEYAAVHNLSTFIEMLHLILGDGPAVSGVDFGCGSHFFVDEVRMRYRWNALGYDPDPEAIREARVKYPRSRDAYVVRNPLTQGLPQKDLAMDFVFCNAVVQHFGDDEADSALSEMARVLKYGGICLLIFKRNVDNWPRFSNRRGIRVEVLDHAGGKIRIEDKAMTTAIADLSEPELAKLPKRYITGMRLLHMFSIETIQGLAAKHGLHVIDSVQLPDGNAAKGTILYYSGKHFPTAAIFLRRKERS